MAGRGSESGRRIIVGKRGKRCRRVGNGGSSLFGKIGGNVGEMSGKSFFVKCVYARGNATLR